MYNFIPVQQIFIHCFQCNITYFYNLLQAFFFARSKSMHVFVCVCVKEMCILILALCSFTGELYYLTAGKSHVVGRKDGDLILLDDQSVSRQHAVITVVHSIKDVVRNFISQKDFFLCRKYQLSYLFILTSTGVKLLFYRRALNLLPGNPTNWALFLDL